MRLKIFLNKFIKKQRQSMIECAQYIENNNLCCTNTPCRYFLSSEEDRNCSIISAERNGPQNLREIATKMGFSYVRIFQIEKDAMRKMVDKNEELRTLLNE